MKIYGVYVSHMGDADFKKSVPYFTPKVRDMVLFTSKVKGNEWVKKRNDNRKSVYATKYFLKTLYTK